VAGRIRQPGRFAILLPREIDPSAAGARMPLPPDKPVPGMVAAAQPSQHAAAPPNTAPEEPRHPRRYRR
jgi:hypothetical protein